MIRCWVLRSARVAHHYVRLRAYVRAMTYVVTYLTYLCGILVRIACELPTFVVDVSRSDISVKGDHGCLRVAQHARVKYFYSLRAYSEIGLEGIGGRTWFEAMYDPLIRSFAGRHVCVYCVRAVIQVQLSDSANFVRHFLAWR